MKKSFYQTLRKSVGLKQDEMAAKLGISYSHYTKLETNKVNPSYDLLLSTKKIFPKTDMNKFFQ
ncbi:helix-turn-helix domain-containing protein [Enterococcus sp. SMC-9]|nr:helix-turn-helix domain-containing protein [Enterococcus sp. SMC-9]